MQRRKGFVYQVDAGDVYRAGRTVRSLAAAGIEGIEIPEFSWAMLEPILAEEPGVLFVRAGVWLVETERFRWPLPSATGLPLCAVGATRNPSETDFETARVSTAWNDLFAASGGDFSNASRTIPIPPVFFLDPLALRALTGAKVSSLNDLFRMVAADFRLVHFSSLDAYEDRGLRLLQVITSLQRGGAERVTLDLMAELPGLNTRVKLVTLGRAVREAFSAPAGTEELAGMARDPEARGAALRCIGNRFGADVVHGHLLAGTDARSISAAGLPLVLTAHNTRAGWPAGLAELRAADAALLAACARAVETDLHSARIPVAIRTVRNGIALSDFQPTPERMAAGKRWREKWGFGPDDFVLVAVANPRPQKRLHLLPGVLAALRAALTGRHDHSKMPANRPPHEPACAQTAEVPPHPSPLPRERENRRQRFLFSAEMIPGREARLVFVGEVLRGNPEAERCLAETRAEVARLGLEAQVRWTGPISDVGEILAAADALVSTSAHEGLSLAQLEALAMGCSVVATDVGGAREIAAGVEGFHLARAEASAEEIAEVLVGVAGGVGGGEDEAEKEAEAEKDRGPRERTGGRAGKLSLDWSRQRMAARYRWLYPRAIAAARRKGRGSGLWLIANNFSTGGAQASARRLLLGLQAQGLRVRAVVVEEEPAWPTPGRKELLKAGVPVVAAALDPEGQHETAIEQILSAVDADPPQSVLFWNLRPSFKVALADALFNVPVFDISPGEMFYDSLERYFVKPHWKFGCRTALEYGALLAGVIVKYSAEARRAEQFLGAPVHVVPNGVDIGGEASSINPQTSGKVQAQRPFVFGTAARINPQKRLEDLVGAFHLAHDRLPPYVLKIAGGVERGCADYAQSLRSACNGLPIQWLGEVADVGGFHRELDAFAMISEPAGCPNASLEAIAAGLPIVATDCGGASEQVVDGRTGRLVPARDAHALAEALVEIATGAESRRAMGVAGQQLARERFSLERMIADYKRICLG